MSSVHPSVRLSVTLLDQDHIGWKSWKLIARTISPTSSLFVAQRSSTYSQGNMEWGRLEVWLGKSGICWGTKAAISLKHIKIEESKLLWSAYRNSPTLFRTVPSPTPYGLLFPKIGGSLYGGPRLDRFCPISPNPISPNPISPKLISPNPIS